MKLIFILFIHVTTFTSLFALNYYVDAVSGNDSNNGLSDTSAWKTVQKASNHSFSPGFSPGDQILFKRGQEHHGELLFASNGASGNPIIIGAYPETGDRPILTTIEQVPDSASPSSWTEDSSYSGIWYITVSKDPTRVWFDGTEYVEADAQSSNPLIHMDSHYLWYYDVSNSRLYVYTGSSSNTPADVYTRIEGLQEEQHVLNFGNRSYITIQNLTLLGGYNGCVVIMRGSHDFIVENCLIGKSCKGLLITGIDNSSNYDLVYNITLRNNDICAFGDANRYSSVTLAYNYYFPNLSDGIYLWAAEDVEIHDNIFYNWGHADIELTDDNYGLKRVDIYNNTFYGGRVDYTRALCYNGREPDKVADIAFYANKIYDKNVRNQINGEQMLFYDNIIDGVTQAPAYPTASRGTGQGLNLYAVDDWPNASNNIVAFNTITNCAEPGLSIWNMTTSGNPQVIGNNLIVNNTIVNCGTLIGGTGNYNYLTNLSVDIEETNVSDTVMDNIFLNNTISEDSGNDVHYKGTVYTVPGFNELYEDDGNVIGGNN